MVRVILAGVALTGMCWPDLAVAQPTAFLLIPGSNCVTECSGTLMSVAPDVPAVLSSAVVPEGNDMESPYVTPDGRFVVWLRIGNRTLGRASRVALHDRQSGATGAVPVSPDSTILVGNPSRPEVYLGDRVGAYALSPSGTRRLQSSTCPLASPMHVSADGRRVLFYCYGDGVVLNHTFVVDVDTGALVSTTPVFSHVAALSRDGSEIYAVESVGSDRRLRRYDVATLAITGDVQVPHQDLVLAIHVDARLNRLLLAGGRLTVVSGATLDVLQIQTLLTGVNPGLLHSVLDDTGARLYVSQSHYYAEIGYTTYSYRVLDTDSFASVVGVEGPRGRFVPAPRPASPVLSALVSGASVQLSWVATSVAAATTRYVLEVGSAPGLNDIFAGLDAGMQTSFSANGVPPGRYYARVRAANYTGPSAPSNEVLVQVP